MDGEIDESRWKAFWFAADNRPSDRSLKIVETTGRQLMLFRPVLLSMKIAALSRGGIAVTVQRSADTTSGSGRLRTAIDGSNNGTTFGRYPAYVSAY